MVGSGCGWLSRRAGGESPMMMAVGENNTQAETIIIQTVMWGLTGKCVRVDLGQAGVFGLVVAELEFSFRSVVSVLRSSVDKWASKGSVDFGF